MSVGQIFCVVPVFSFSFPNDVDWINHSSLSAKCFLLERIFSFEISLCVWSHVSTYLLWFWQLDFVDTVSYLQKQMHALIYFKQRLAYWLIFYPIWLYVIEWKVDKNIFILKTFKVICQESDGIRNKMKIKFF